MAKLQSFQVEVERENGKKSTFDIVPLVNSPGADGPNWSLKNKPGIKFENKTQVATFFKRQYKSVKMG